MSDAAADGVTLRHLTDDDVAAGAAVFRAALGAPDPDEASVTRFAHYWDVGRSLGAFDGDGRLLGVAATWPATFTVEGGAEVACAAVPSVGVRPDSHGRGIGRALLERQVREAAGRGAAVMALNASEVGIYGRFGYGPTSRWRTIEVDPHRVKWRADAPAPVPGSVEEVDDLATAVDLLEDLHRRALGGWSGELARPDGWWYPARNPTKERPAPKTAVHRDVDGVVDAAIRFTVEIAFDDRGFANKVEVQDSIALDTSAELLLWRWLLDRNLTGTLRTDRVNPRLPLGWAMEDPRVVVPRVDSDAVWVRVLDVPATLGARTTRATDPVRIRVLDPLVPVNDRVWVLSGEDGMLRVEAGEDRAEVTVPVDLLAPMAWGFVRARSLVEAGRLGAAADDALARLDALLATDGPAWCSTSF